MHQSKGPSGHHHHPGNVNRGNPGKHSRWRLYSLMAILCRIVVVLSSTSFIHPDEHFQNTQIAIQDVFKPSNAFLDRTWEWDSLRLPDQPIGGGPVRSIVPVWITSHLGLRLLRFATSLGWIKLSTRSLVIAPRLVLFLLSIFVDRLVFRALQFPELELLYLSSLSSSLFICRTFSNSLESCLFATIFILSLSIVNKNKEKNTQALSIITWTLLNLLAVFVRVSYICFGLPIVLMIFYTRLLRSRYLFLLAGSTAFVGATILIYFDSLYFGRWPTIAPISFMLYNIDPRNLAQHGTHPYFLHLLVNGPILFGPALWFNGWWQICRRLKSKSNAPNIVKLSIASVVSGTLLLSLQPHQEPRFLLPLTLPLSILSMKPKSKARSTLPKSFWVVHLLHSIITVILFGYLHQGGLQSALEALPSTTTTLFSYKTFDIPSSIVINKTKLSQVVNLRGASEKVMIEKLCERFKLSWNEGEEVVLIAPRWSISKNLENQNFIHLFSASIWPHLDLDRLKEFYTAGPLRWGIGIYQINLKKFLESKSCID